MLKFFEKARGEGKSSSEWEGRQERKIVGGFGAFEELVKGKGGNEYLFGDVLTIADIAVACAVGFVAFNGALGEGWEEKYPKTAAWWRKLDERESFRSTRPVMCKFDPVTTGDFADLSCVGQLILKRTRSFDTATRARALRRGEVR